MAARRTCPHLFGLQPLLLPKGFPLWEHSVSLPALSAVSVNLIKYLIGLLPGTKFLLQASKLPVLLSDAAEAPGNIVL